MLFVEFSPQTPETDLRYSTVAFNSCEVYGDELWLRTGGDMDYKIAHYDEVLPDVDAFLAKYKNGGVLKLGYQSVSPRYDPDYYRVYYARGAANEMFVTQEKECEVRARHTKEERPKIIALFSALMLLLLSFIPGSIYAGRHADTLNPKIVRIFFKPDYILCSGGSAPKRKRRGKK